MHRLQFVTQLLDHPDAVNILTLVGLGLVGLAACYLLSRIDLTLLAVTALVLQVFSGNWSLMGIPVPLDRVVLVVTLGALVLKGPRHVGERKLVLRPLHLALLSAAAWAFVSGLIAGTITGHLGFYAWLDRLGIVPFIFFTLAPIFFGTPKQRRTLLAALVGLGLYLGLIGVLEGLHAYRFILPRYIANPNAGIQFGRARGPFVESTADGFCTFVCAVAAAMGLHYWTSRRARFVCYLTIVLAGATLFFTLTRGVWIAGFVGAVAALLLNKPTRRVVAPLLLVGVVAVSGALALSPTLRSEATGRTESQSPVWDRQNTDLAAIRIIEEKPLTGVGWENFINVSGNYMRQQGTYPITGIGIEVHNVFLSHAAELGIPGLLLWLLALGGALYRGFFPRGLSGKRGPPRDPRDAELTVWRTGGVAVFLCFLVIADLAPFSAALPNTMLWLWLGVLAAPYTSRFRVPVQVRASFPAPSPARADETPPVGVPALRPAEV